MYWRVWTSRTENGFLSNNISPLYCSMHQFKYSHAIQLLIDTFDALTMMRALIDRKFTGNYLDECTFLFWRHLKIVPLDVRNYCGSD